jgi:hypothetical protein
MSTLTIAPYTFTESDPGQASTQPPRTYHNWSHIEAFLMHLAAVTAIPLAQLFDSDTPVL